MTGLPPDHRALADAGRQDAGHYDGAPMVDPGRLTRPSDVFLCGEDADALARALDR